MSEFFFHNPNSTIFSAADQRSASITHGDIDGDGDADVIIANGRHWPDQNEIFLNDGASRFKIAYDLGKYRSTSYAAELADLDGDGDLDIATGNDRAPNRLFFNDGKGHFTEKGTFGANNSNTRNLTLQGGSD